MGGQEIGRSGSVRDFGEKNQPQQRATGPCDAMRGNRLTVRESILDVRVAVPYFLIIAHYSIISAQLQ
jgi:hypothetical protein